MPGDNEVLSIRHLRKAITVSGKFKKTDMRNMTKYLFLIVLSLVLTSCNDVFEREDEIVENYFVAPDPEKDCKTLYFRTSTDLTFERIRCIEKAGHAKGYILVEVDTEYRFLKIDSDQPSDIGDPAVISNISKPMNKNEFKAFLDSLDVKDFDFSFVK